jgi:hypothetical protein
MNRGFFMIRHASVHRSMTLLAAGAITGLAVAGYGLFTAKGTRAHGVPPEAVAMVNQRPILRTDFMTQTQIQYSIPYAQTTMTQRRKIVEDMINEELMMQRGLEIDLPSYDPDVRTALVAGVELEVDAEVLAERPTVAELKQYYSAHQDKYSSQGVMQLRDLVAKAVPAPPLAELRSLITRASEDIRHGVSLSDVIHRYGLVDSGRFMDTGKVDTGDIYQFAVKAKVDALSFRAALALKDGEVSEPIELSDGVHLIVMLKHRFPVPQTYEEAENQIWTDYRADAQSKVNAANLAYLRARADITVAPEYVP